MKRTQSTPSTPSSHRSPPFLLAGILFIALVLRIVFFVGYANVDPWDDTLYLKLARHVRDGTLARPLRAAVREMDDGRVSAASAFVVRRATYVPIALAQALFGASERASALPSLLASLGTLLLVYLIGLRLAGNGVALVAAALYALVPLDLVYSTRILADVPTTFWVTASVAAVIEATRGAHADRGRTLLFILSGLCLGFAYATRLSGLLGIPLVLAALACAPDRKRAFAESLLTWFVLGAVLFADGYRYGRSTGHFGFVFQIERAASLGMFVSNPEAVFHPLHGLAVHCSYEEGVPHHFLKLFAGTVSHYGGLKLFSSFAPFGAAALLFCLWKRRLGLLVFWVAFVFLFYQYGFRGLQWNGEQGVLDYFLVAHRPRYLHLLLPPLVLLLGYLVVETMGKSRATGILLVLLLTGPALHRVRQNAAFYRGSLQDMRLASSFLTEQARSPIYSDPWGVELLQFFAESKLADIRVLDERSPPEPGAWVVLGGARGYDLSSQEVASRLPRSYAAQQLRPERPPDSWRLAHRIRGPRNPARSTDLVIYQIVSSN